MLICILDWWWYRVRLLVSTYEALLIHSNSYNIEAMSKYLPVDTYFSHVYLVDLSPSLLDIARQRFTRLGWKNVSVVCQDARAFRLPNRSEKQIMAGSDNRRASEGSPANAVDLLTMSYSLSMIPDYYSVVDSLAPMLKHTGIVGVCDFYVQSIVDVASRNYTGGTLDRHVNWLGRLFWRAWFDVDRVGLEGARRDYLEYRFGTLSSMSERNYLLGGIPYYIFIGRAKQLSVGSAYSSTPFEQIGELDASYTESPYLSAMQHRHIMSNEVESDSTDIRSKAYECAVVNLSSNLPLPSAFYQNHYWRIFYNDMAKKHTQFNNDYIYVGVQ